MKQVPSFHQQYSGHERFNPATLIEVLRWRSRCDPNGEAYRFLIDDDFDGSVITYFELERRARAIGAALSQKASPGTRALLL
ncbi:MAG TPA: hypothetical protein VI756_04605, partial [Blastocatellia bacterium]